jgi:hypothetical protein
MVGLQSSKYGNIITITNEDAKLQNPILLFKFPWESERFLWKLLTIWACALKNVLQPYPGIYCNVILPPPPWSLKWLFTVFPTKILSLPFHLYAQLTEASKIPLSWQNNQAITRQFHVCPLTSSFLGSKIFLSVSFSNTCNICSILW